MNSDRYTFFWQDASPFSQWHKSGFKIDDIYFKTAEHYMMWKKAVVFKDFKSAEDVLQAKHSRDAKAIGRKVKNFDSKKWSDICQDVVYEGNYAKFTQNKDLLKILLDTGNTLLVEASPYDSIWGIGLREEDAKRIPESNWPGTNFLGKILTKLRDDLKKDI